MAGNPLIGRYRYSLMRPMQFWVYVSIYIGVVAILLFVNYSIYEYRQMYDNQANLNKSLYCQFLGIEIIMLIFWGLFNSAAAIRDEKVEKTYDFFKALPLSAAKKMTGILIGKNLVMLLLGALNLGFVIFYATRAEVPPVFQLQIILLLLLTAVLANSIGLIGSLCATAKPNKAGKVGTIIVILFLAPMVLQGLFAVSLLEKIQDVKAKFYTVEIPVLLMAAVAVGYFCFWSILAGLRKLNRDDESALRKIQAYFFTIGYVAIVFGLFYPYFKSWNEELRIAYFLLTIFPALIIPLSALSSFSDYLEASGSRQMIKRISGLSLICRSNMCLFIGHFLLWAATVMFVEYQTGTKSLLLPIIAVMFTFLVVLILMLEVMMVYEGTNKKIGLLLVFIVGVYIGLPPIASGIFENSTFYLHSPAGFLVGALSEWYFESALLARIAAVNILLSIVPLLLVIRQYSAIVSTRRKLSQATSL